MTDRNVDYVSRNDRERERLRALIGRLSDEDLARSEGGEWTVAEELGHVAFWDARALALGRKLREGRPFTPDDDESEDVNVINDAAHRLIAAIPPRDAADLALRIAEETDALIASLPPEAMYPLDDDSPLNALRASHRGEHLDQIEERFPPA